MRQHVPVARYVVLALLFAVSAAYRARVSADVVAALSGRIEAARAPFDLQTVGLMRSDRVGRLRPEAEQAGLRTGDTVVAVNGRRLRGVSTATRALEHAPPGQPVTLTVRHPGSSAEETLAIGLVVTRNGPAPIGDWLFGLGLSIAMPVLCVLSGFWVAAVRPRDPRAWLLLALLLSFSVVLGDRGSAWDNPWHILGLLYYGVLFFSLPLWIFVLGLYFPDRFEWERRRPAVKWLLLGPLAAYAAFRVLVVVAESESFELAARLTGAVRLVGAVAVPLWVAGTTASMVCLAIKWSTARDPDARRRLRLLTLGTTASLGPVLLLAVWWGGAANAAAAQPNLYSVALLMLVLFPVTLAYVIVVQRAMDVHVVVRQGLQYALARGGVRLLQPIAIAAAILLAWSLAVDPGANQPQKLRAIGLAVLAVVLVRQFAGRLAVWVDRRFFREAYDAETILTELSDEVRTMVETGPLLRRVAERLSQALHVPQVALLLEQGGLFRPAFALGYAGSPEVVLGPTAATVERLRQENGPVLAYLEDESSWVNRLPPDRASERAGLRELGTQLLLPLAVKDKLLGIMSLGPKLADAPFSGSDLRLLRLVAAQTGMALENSRLSEAMAQELAQRERQRRELEIAREVQELLFPQKRPALPGLDYAGACRPARQVGGDYYDFLELAGGRFGFAIADVSGKGIPAALLMAGLQGALRTHARQPGLDLAVLMRSVNQLLYETSSANRYATFFYGQYDPATRALAYVNAGHNAPMVLRDGQVLRLETGGLLMGLFPQAGYEEGRLALCPGDLLLAFTDGVTEAMSPDGEEWGEARLTAAARECRGMPAEEILHRIMDGADRFAASTPQYDDMTLVVIRVL